MVWFVLLLIIDLLVSLFAYGKIINNKNYYGLTPWLKQLSGLNKNPPERQKTCTGFSAVKQNGLFTK